MRDKKLCLNTSPQHGLPVEEQIRRIGEAGFDGFFTAWEPGAPVERWARQAEALGLEYQSIHAPCAHVAEIWREGPAGDAAVDELRSCLADCARWNVPIMISHAYIGFDGEPCAPTDLGVERFGRLVRDAEACGVRIAFENTEGEPYLAKLLESFADSPAVGYCWDSGHEMCYSHSRNLLALYGGKLICTHLNDSLGVRDHAGRISPLDDLHLLPFDGIADWKKLAGRLSACGYQGPLTFELKPHSQPGRHENDVYARMDIRDYFAACYVRACRVAALVLAAEGRL